MKYCNYQIDTGESRDVRRVLLAYFLSRGYDENDSILAWRWWCFNPFKRYLSANTYERPDYLNISIEQLFDNKLPSLEQDDSVSVPLNDTYIAVVSPNRIKVGCQIFSFEALDKLVQAVAKMRTKQ